jgi:hypothetical protein
MTRPHHLFDDLAYPARLHIAATVNAFAPLSRSVTAATLAYVSPARAAVALERAAHSHSKRSPVSQTMARILCSIVDAVART